ncbi:replication initiation protein (plasmid) [Macrococcus psychrotolerans]|uniref:Replication initiation protein n=1 Tax=Macrococcus psychrotolerans TaxID=3039389 RepID=A0AAU6RIK7_9STAP
MDNQHNYVTKYQNELNLIPLKDFTPIEIDLFFSICTKMKDKQTDKVRHSFEDLKALSEYRKHTTIEDFADRLQIVYEKMQTLKYKRIENKRRENFVLFPYFVIDEKEQYVEISINKDLIHILNNLTGNFTRFELREFTSIQSAYSKNMFRLLKQFRNTGLYKVSLDDFKELLDIPRSYQMSDIDKRVLKLIQRDLADSFQNLEIKKTKKGRKVVALEFTFDKENLKKKKNEIKIDETLRSQSEEMFKEFIK